jgi:hypothetical protein
MKAERETQENSLAKYRVTELLKKNRKPMTQNEIQKELKIIFNNQFIQELKESPKLG